MELFICAHEFGKLEQPLRFYIDHLCAVMEAGGENVLAKAFDDACRVGRLAGGQRRDGGYVQPDDAGYVFVVANAGRRLSMAFS